MRESIWGVSENRAALGGSLYVASFFEGYKRGTPF